MTKKLTNRYKTNGTDVRFINSNLYLNVSDIGIYLYYKIYHISINKKKQHNSYFFNNNSDVNNLKSTY